MNLKDMPDEVPAWLKSSIEKRLLAVLRTEANGRKRDVERGAETPELSATLLDKFGWGMVSAATAIGFDTKLMAEVDRLVREIDPSFVANRNARWAARPAAICLTARS